MLHHTRAASSALHTPSLAAVCCSHLRASQLQLQRKQRLAAAGQLPCSHTHAWGGLGGCLQQGRKKNRWGDGLEAPASGARQFFPPGWTPSKDLAQAVQALGLTEQDVATLMDKAQRKLAMLSLLNIHVSDRLVAAVLAYTQETPNLYAALNQACRTPGGQWEQLLAHFRDYLHLLNSAVQALPNFSGEVYRGIDDCTLGEAYAVGNTITWQQFSSASKKPRVAVRFLGKSSHGILRGSLFVIQVTSLATPSSKPQAPQRHGTLLVGRRGLMAGWWEEAEGG